MMGNNAESCYIKDPDGNTHSLSGARRRSEECAIEPLQIEPARQQLPGNHAYDAQGVEMAIVAGTCTGPVERRDRHHGATVPERRCLDQNLAFEYEAMLAIVRNADLAKQLGWINTESRLAVFEPLTAGPRQPENGRAIGDGTQ